MPDSIKGRDDSLMHDSTFAAIQQSIPDNSESTTSLVGEGAKAVRDEAPVQPVILNQAPTQPETTTESPAEDTSKTPQTHEPTTANQSPPPSHPPWAKDPETVQLFEYLLAHDFQEEVDLHYLLNLDFELTPEEDALTPNISNVFKLLKIVFYRTGITTYNQQKSESVMLRNINQKLKAMEDDYKVVLKGIKDSQANI